MPHLVPGSFSMYPADAEVYPTNHLFTRNQVDGSLISCTSEGDLTILSFSDKTTCPPSTARGFDLWTDAYGRFAAAIAVP
jgi:hypothetical protein